MNDVQMDPQWRLGMIVDTESSSGGPFVSVRSSVIVCHCLRYLYLCKDSVEAYRPPPPVALTVNTIQLRRLWDLRFVHIQHAG